MRTVLFIPPLSWLSGGLATLYSLATTLHHQGHEVCVTSLHRDIPGLEALLAQGIVFLPWKGLALSESDIWVVPESHPNALAPGLQQKANTLVYVQNWYYMLSSLPEHVHWEQFPVSFLAVSHPVAWFMEHCLRLRVLGVLPPVVAPWFFARERQETKHLRIAFMPRKNAALGRQMRDVALAVLGPRHMPVEWVALQNMSQQEVAEQMASSHLFLSTGFPEGFGLPPVEAMAAGCVPVGFTGFGGWEYMRPAMPDLLAGGGHVAVPPLQPPCDVPYSLKPNGLYAADGDTLSGGMLLAYAMKLAFASSDTWQSLRAAGGEAAALFSLQQQQERIKKIWAGLTAPR